MLLAQRILVLVEIEESIRNRRGCWLVVGVMIRLQVRVAQCFLDGDTLGRVEGQQLLEQVQGELVALREEGSEGDLLLKGEGPDVLACATGLDAVVIFHGGGAQDIQDQGQLVVI